MRSSTSKLSRLSKQTDAVSPHQGSDEIVAPTIQPAIPEDSDLISLDLEVTTDTSGDHNESDLVVEHNHSR